MVYGDTQKITIKIIDYFMLQNIKERILPKAPPKRPKDLQTIADQIDILRVRIQKFCSDVGMPEP